MIMKLGDTVPSHLVRQIKIQTGTVFTDWNLTMRNRYLFVRYTTVSQTNNSGGIDNSWQFNDM